MAELKIKADSGGGTVSFKGPASTTDHAAVQLTLPVDDGTSGQFLKTDGSGALSWATAGTALTGSTDNTICTVTGANAIQGEAGLTYDGNDLYVKSGEGNDASIHLYSDEGDDNADKWRILNAQSTSNKLRIASYAGGSWADHLNIETGGDLEVVRGNVKFATGKGIDFSATSDGTTMSSELLDDYEEGSFDAVMKNSVTLHGTIENMQYTKIGRQVTITGEFRVDSDNSNSDLYIDNLPFASTAATDSGSMAASACVTHDHNFTHGAAVFAYIMEGSNDIRFVELQDNGGYANADADSGAYYCLSITYFTS